MIKMKKFFLILTMLCSSGIKAATVTSPLDDGNPGTLRSVLASASGGGEIIDFNIPAPGIILLNEMLGELVIDKQLIIDGDNNITIDGQNQINICFHITNSGNDDASNSIIQNITIQNFNGHDVDPGSGATPTEQAYGILIEAGPTGCSVLNTTIRNIHSGSLGSTSGQAAGIFCKNDLTSADNNHISYISSEDNIAGHSGNSYGIRVVNTLGTCNNNRISFVRSGDASGRSGFVSGIKLFDGLLSGTLAGDCSNNIISNLSIGSAGSFAGTMSVIEIDIIGNDCKNNTIYNISSGTSGTSNISGGSIIAIEFIRAIGNITNNTIRQMHGGDSIRNTGIILGMNGSIVEGDCNNNVISDLFGGSSLNENSNDIVGIRITSIDGDCSRNKIHNLQGGDGFIASGKSIGILINDLLKGNCLNNIVTDISTANSNPSEESGGIQLHFVDDASLIACNTIRGVSGGQNSLNFGMEIEDGNNLTIRNNTIDSVANINGPAHGLILGSMSDEDKVVSNSLASFNTISNITGNSTNGFGITILGPTNQSTGNDLLNNSIFNINGKAINILDNGVPIDATITLQSITCGTNKVFIRGTLEPEPGFEESEFLVQFFISAKNAPPQTMNFLGETTIQADDTTPFMLEIKTCSTDTTQFITATATAQPSSTAENNNTSEVSNAILGCNSSTICSLLCSPNQTVTSPACPIS